MVVDERELRPDVVVHDHRGTAGRANPDDVVELSINTIRTLAIDAVEERGAGALTRAEP